MAENSVVFDHNQLEQVCRLLADRVTGVEIHQLLSRQGFDDPSPQSSKWARLLDALELQQVYDDSGEAVICTIESVMAPVRFAAQPQAFAACRDALNRVLAFAGYMLGDDGKVRMRSKVQSLPRFPIEIGDSLTRFQADHPAPEKSAFIMMRFAHTAVHQQITSSIKDALQPHGISGLRADDKHYHDDLFPNVKTYMHGCGFGIAVFERIETETFNPNVALEVGYMLALGKPVCLLKERTLNALQADLGGMLYREFDSYSIASTVPGEISKWITDRGLATG